MAEAKLFKVINAQYKKAIEYRDDMIKFLLKDVDGKLVIYLLIHGLDGNHDEYKGGEYIVRMKFPAKYPFDPPEFYFMTPNAFYEVEKKCCISIGEFHADDYKPVLGVSGFARELVNGLVNWESMGGGIALMKTSKEEKAAKARNSVEYNKKHNAELLAEINEKFAEYSARWKKPE